MPYLLTVTLLWAFSFSLIGEYLAGQVDSDFAVLARVGFSCAPADAVPEVRARVDWVSQFGGGRGAARELVELILRAQGSWDAIVASYEQEAHATDVSPSRH